MDDIIDSSMNTLSTPVDETATHDGTEGMVPTAGPAHAKGIANALNFVDIFGTDTSMTGLCNWGASDVSAADGSDVVGTRRGTSDETHMPKRLTFSDRVVHEARKLKQRLHRSHTENPGHVTPTAKTSGRISCAQYPVNDDEFLPYTAWVGGHVLKKDCMNSFSPAINRNFTAGGRSPLRMQSDAQVMEWFRNKFNLIESTYNDRAAAISSLAIREERVDEPMEAVTSTLEEEIKQLREENERLKALESIDAQRRQELSEALSKVEELENTLAVERKHNEENLKDKMVLQQRITNYAEELKNLNESMDIVKAMHTSELEEHENHKAELLSKIAQLQKDVTHFNDNLFSCYKVIESQKTEQSYLKEQNCTLNDELRRLKLDVRRLYEANSNLKSQNLSLIEINNRIRTKTLFKADVTDTCSTRGSCSSKASYISNDDFSFFHVINDTPSVNLCSDYGDSVQETKQSCYTGRSSDQHDGLLKCSAAVGTISSMSKRVTTEDKDVGQFYGKQGGVDYSASARQEDIRRCNAVVGSGNILLAGSYNKHDKDGSTTHSSNNDFSGKGDASTKDTCIVDHSTVYSADNSTPNYVEALSMRDLSTDSLGESSRGLTNKSWLLEKVSRISNRDSLDYLKEKIKLITSQECKTTSLV